ncbi:glycine betaine/L-proline transporter ProP [Tomitella cavernea]|uniref:Glycine betaine/L-proline transporter ProP n=2 Tax=Tomitella cavernea TaxID=1387982 RepID=A0ABP9C0I0_9ACTN
MADRDEKSRDAPPRRRRRRWRLSQITVSAPRNMRRSITGTAVGNFMEWYDFGVYAYLATVIATVFFPGNDSGAANVVGTFGILAASFVVRPLGGAVLGPLGDRIGRKRVLTLTITIMAIATTTTGLLPGYSDHGFWGGVGVWAVILLLITRLLQGFSTGGEYVGAMTYVDEHAPDRKRGMMGGFLPTGTLTGYVVGAVLVTGLTAGLSDSAMQSWGWRIPFLIGAPMGLIALYMRLRLEETPAYENLKADERVSEQGAAHQLRRTIIDQWPQVLVCIGLVLTFNVTNYMLSGYLPTYLSDIVDVPQTDALVIVTVVLLLLALVVVFVARLSDRFGRKPIMWTGCGLLIVVSVPAVALMGADAGYFVVFLGVLLVGLMLLCLNSTEPSVLPALFPTSVRYGALAIAYNISVSAFGGTTPLIASGLISLTGNTLIPAYILIAAGIVGAVSVYFTPESSNRRLPGATPTVATEKEARYVAKVGTIEDPDAPGTGVTETEPPDE